MESFAIVVTVAKHCILYVPENRGYAIAFSSCLLIVEKIDAVENFFKFLGKQLFIENFFVKLQSLVPKRVFFKFLQDSQESTCAGVF